MPNSHTSKICLTIVIILAAVSLLTPRNSSGSRQIISANPPKAEPSTLARVSDIYGKIPLSFEANEGQLAPPVKFLTRGRGYNLSLTASEVVLTLAKRSVRQKDALDGVTEKAKNRPVDRQDQTTLRMKMVNASASSRVEGQGVLPGKSNYFLGSNPAKWRKNVTQFKRVRYTNVYSGIDLVYYGNEQQQLEYDFIVGPGIDPHIINLSFDGARSIEIDDRGDLVFLTDNGKIRQNKPTAYQEIQSVRRTVSCSYALLGRNEIGFMVGSYDPSYPLVIDPVLDYSSYFGGLGTEIGHDIAVDGAGNAYITGVSAGVGGTPNVFVTKLNSTGSAIVFSTYLGGDDADLGQGIAVDSSGNVFVAGDTRSTNFPTTANAFQTNFGGNQGAFVAKLNSTGDSLTYSTYFGNSDNEVTRMAINSSGDVYLLGVTGEGLPTTVGAFDVSYGGVGDAYIAKLNHSGTSLLFSTYLGGGGQELPGGIVLDSADNVYAVGYTGSSDFPTTPGVLNETGFSDAFISKLNSSGSALIYSTHFGNQTFASAIAVDATGNVFLTGNTSSTDFPVTPGAFQPTLAGSSDAFVAKLNPSGSSLMYSTFLGGTNIDSGNDIAIDPSGSAYITGNTRSPDFPLANAVQDTYGGSFFQFYGDAFVTKLNPTGGAVFYSTFLGGIDDDRGTGIFVDSLGGAYVTGSTSSSNFPLVGLLQPNYGGATDAFIAKITDSQSEPTPTPTPNPCSIGSCSASSASHGTIGVAVNFNATVTTDCFFSPPTYEWDFGDGSPHVFQPSPLHIYAAAGTYTWTMTVSFPGLPTCVKTGEIDIFPSCAISDPSPADGVTRLITDDNDTQTLGNRTPVILIHGIHGNQRKQNNFDDIQVPNRDYFKHLLSFFNNPRFEQSYKIYRFHYVSDRYPVSEIARGLRNDIDSKICEDPTFDTKLIIIAHSMGGLIARSYMNQYTENVGAFAGLIAGERVEQLITLATPHHGSPGANEVTRFQLASNDSWQNWLALASVFYWGLDLSQGVFNTRIKDTVSFDHPNRADLWWDNYDGIAHSGNSDINNWLAVLNSQERYASKISAYYGFFLNKPRNAFITSHGITDSSPGSILSAAFHADRAEDEHTKLLIANITLDYGMRHIFSFNDGMVPVESAYFKNTQVGSRTACPGFDHLDMVEGGARRKCSNGQTLFQSLNTELGIFP